MSDQSPAVLVTGGAVRVGRAIGEAFAVAGWDVGVHYRGSADAAAETVAALRDLGSEASSYQADLGDLDTIDDLVARFVSDFPAARCLVNSASRFTHDRLATVTAEDWDAHLRINALVPALLARSFVEATTGSVSIVNVIDRKVTDPTPDFFSYTVSKVALAGITTMLARELAPRARVNAVGPGLVLRSGDQTDEEFERLYSHTPLGVGSAPADIAAAVRSLATNPAVTGQLLLVDGGRHLAGWTPPER